MEARHNDHSESNLYGFYPDGYLSQSITIRVLPDGYLSGSLLKDGGSPIMITRSASYTSSTLTSTRSSNSLYGSYPDGYPSGSLLKDKGSPTTAARQHSSAFGISPARRKPRAKLYCKSFSLSEAQLNSWDFSRLEVKLACDYYGTDTTREPHNKPFQTKQSQYDPSKIQTILPLQFTASL